MADDKKLIGAVVVAAGVVVVAAGQLLKAVAEGITKS